MRAKQKKLIELNTNLLQWSGKPITFWTILYRHHFFSLFFPSAAILYEPWAYSHNSGLCFKAIRLFVNLFRKEKVEWWVMGRAETTRSSYRYGTYKLRGCESLGPWGKRKRRKTNPWALLPIKKKKNPLALLFYD